MKDTTHSGLACTRRVVGRDDLGNHLLELYGLLVREEREISRLVRLGQLQHIRLGREDAGIVGRDPNPPRPATESMRNVRRDFSWVLMRPPSDSWLPRLRRWCRALLSDRPVRLNVPDVKGSSGYPTPLLVHGRIFTRFTEDLDLVYGASSLVTEGWSDPPRPRGAAGRGNTRRDPSHSPYSHSGSRS